VEQDREMGIHPVWVLLGLNYFGFIWGPVGMLISVPMLALLKSAALSAIEEGDMPALSWGPLLLRCLEGRYSQHRSRASSVGGLKRNTFPPPPSPLPRLSAAEPPSPAVGAPALWEGPTEPGKDIHAEGDEAPASVAADAISPAPAVHVLRTAAGENRAGTGETSAGR